MWDQEERLEAKLAWSGGYDEDGKPHGQGTLTYPPTPRPASDAAAEEDAAEDDESRSGAVYSGELVHGVREGHGKYVWPPVRAAGPDAGAGEPDAGSAPGACYEGGYVAGARHGKGTMTYPGGARYEGEWATGMRSGFGTCWYPGGDIYQGEWRAGRRHGEGSQHCAALEAQYIGDWADGRFVQGRLVLKDGSWLTMGASMAEQHMYRSAAGLAQHGSITAAGWQPSGGVAAG